MPSNDLDIQAIADKLIFFAGKSQGLDAATTVEGFGCLATLPQVEASVPFNAGLKRWREAIEEAITEAAGSLNGDYSILDGRTDRVTVASARLREAITLTFNLRHEAGLGKAELRRPLVNEALGLSLSVRSYRGNPGGERNLMAILAKQLVTLAEDIEGVHTERLELSIFMTEVYRDDPRTQTAIRRVETRRTVRANANGESWLIDRGEVVDSQYFTTQDAYETYGDCRLEVPDKATYPPRKLKVHFPRTIRGEARTFGYGVEFHFYSLVRNVVMIRPAEDYEYLTARLVFPPEDQPTAVFKFKERRDEPFFEDIPQMAKLQRNIAAQYFLEVSNPTPHLLLGFKFFYLPTPVG